MLSSVWMTQFKMRFLFDVKWLHTKHNENQNIELQMNCHCELRCFVLRCLIWHKKCCFTLIQWWMIQFFWSIFQCKTLMFMQWNSESIDAMIRMGEGITFNLNWTKRSTDSCAMQSRISNFKILKLNFKIALKYRIQFNSRVSIGNFILFFIFFFLKDFIEIPFDFHLIDLSSVC